MSTTAIRIIVNSYTSRLDRSGNSWSFASIFFPALGRQTSIRVAINGPTDARSAAFKVTQDYEQILFAEVSGIPIRRYVERAKGIVHWDHLRLVEEISEWYAKAQAQAEMNLSNNHSTEVLRGLKDAVIETIKDHGINNMPMQPNDANNYEVGVWKFLKLQSQLTDVDYRRLSSFMEAARRAMQLNYVYVDIVPHTWHIKEHILAIDSGFQWSLVEWYEKNPATGESGWELKSGWFNLPASEARKLVSRTRYFDNIVSCYDASPNPGEIKGYRVIH